MTAKIHSFGRFHHSLQALLKSLAYTRGSKVLIIVPNEAKKRIWENILKKYKIDNVTVEVLNNDSASDKHEKNQGRNSGIHQE